MKVLCLFTQNHSLKFFRVCLMTIYSIPVNYSNQFIFHSKVKCHRALVRIIDLLIIRVNIQSGMTHKVKNVIYKNVK